MDWLILILLFLALFIARWAVHNWRELAIWFVMTAALVLLFKLTGLSSENALTYTPGPPASWSVTLTLTITVALLLSAVVMLAVKEIMARRGG